MYFLRVNYGNSTIAPSVRRTEEVFVCFFFPVDSQKLPSQQPLIVHDKEKKNREGDEIIRMNYSW